jgi:hypothetical protein
MYVCNQINECDKQININERNHAAYADAYGMPDIYNEANPGKPSVSWEICYSPVVTRRSRRTRTAAAAEDPRDDSILLTG